MDGYALRAADAQAGARLAVIGVSRAGARFPGILKAGQAVRIFTGAPVPDGADAILIQENAQRQGDGILVGAPVSPGRYVRPPGLDFTAGEILLRAGRRLDSRAVSLAAAMGYASLPVRRRPKVAILANGDELVPPGAEPGPDQIVSSNGVGLSAFVRECGGEPLDLGIAPDRQDAIAASVDRASAADVLVVIGGASVGDHDLVQAALAGKGMTLDFWRIAMRPGKPLMVGRLGAMRVMGFPGNPVSALVCGHVFLKPLIDVMLGIPADSRLATARLGAAMGANDEREDFVRARLEMIAGEPVVTPFAAQDSSMLATFSRADALIVRPAGAPAAASGEHVPILRLEG
ncbi:MAG TPA: gephyrin-like molybdotransferase Glp, partial [Propylenella sp.]|nr:gephyrin-like molybdotransferase Glp [Propylenella sp.]